jgi:uncharacterized protein (TIGR03000 family)
METLARRYRMYRRWFSVVGVPALVAVAVLVVAQSASARPWFRGRRAAYYDYYGPGYALAPGYYYSSYPISGYAPQYTLVTGPGGYTSFYPSELGGQGTRDANAALVDVKVPADAQIWFNDARTRQTGTNRQFESPSLTPGKTYTYDIRARWMGDDGEVTRTKQVTVRAGARVAVDFTKEAR